MFHLQELKFSVAYPVRCYPNTKLLTFAYFPCNLGFPPLLHLATPACNLEPNYTTHIYPIGLKFRYLCFNTIVDFYSYFMT